MRVMFPAFIVISASRVDEVVLAVTFSVTVVVPDEPDVGDIAHHESELDAVHFMLLFTLTVLLSDDGEKEREFGLTEISGLAADCLIFKIAAISFSFLPRNL